MNDIDEKQMMARYTEQLTKEKELQLSLNEHRIDEFTEYCNSLDVELESQDFDYIQTTGIVASKSDILSNLLPGLVRDKDDLVSWDYLKGLINRQGQMAGYVNFDHFVAMVHPFFRRGMHSLNNYAPRFVDLFWSVMDSNIDAYIALDIDRVRINLDSNSYMEADTWFGAPFDSDIRNIPDGISKLRPPLDIEELHNSFFFGSVYSLDLKWSTKGGIKTFQALEFKRQDITIETNGVTYHPVRYIHAEFDLSKGCFRHFDGAVHLYLPEEYTQRRDFDFNYECKSLSGIKAKSKKLFKFNGEVSTDFWAEFSSHFFTGNPLIFEYFTGEYPKHINDVLNRIRAK